MYYPVKVLKRELKDVIKTKEWLIARSFPKINEQEILKIDLVISDMENIIRLVEGIKKSSIQPKDKLDIYLGYKRGVNITQLALTYRVSYKTIQRVIAEVKATKYK